MDERGEKEESRVGFRMQRAEHKCCYVLVGVGVGVDVRVHQRDRSNMPFVYSRFIIYNPVKRDHYDACWETSVL